MARETRKDLVGAIGYAISRWQDEVETYDGAVGDLFDLSAAERRCLSAISYSPQPASALARAANLSPAAVTALIDRLELRGFMRRLPDPDDRRRVMVAPGEAARAMIEHAYLPMFLAGAYLLESYSMDEMRLILRFIEEVAAMQLRQTEILKQTPLPGDAPVLDS